jgi:hypothetical protein
MSFSPLHKNDVVMSSDEISLLAPTVSVDIDGCFGYVLQEAVVYQLQSDAIGAVDFGFNAHHLAKGSQTQRALLRQRTSGHTDNHENSLTGLYFALCAKVQATGAHIGQHGS